MYEAAPVRLESCLADLGKVVHVNMGRVHVNMGRGQVDLINSISDIQRASFRAHAGQEKSHHFHQNQWVFMGEPHSYFTQTGNKFTAKILLIYLT